jgi:hypothetical protein
MTPTGAAILDMLEAEPGDAHSPLRRCDFHAIEKDEQLRRTVVSAVDRYASRVCRRYQVQVANDTGFTDMVWDSGAVASSAESKSIPGSVTLTSGDWYRWRMRVKDGTSWSTRDGAGRALPQVVLAQPPTTEVRLRPSLA